MSESEVRLMALDLEMDESRGGLLCPFCHGGQHGDKSFAMTRIGSGILYHCFRAKCTKGGLIPSTYGIQQTVRKKKSPKIFTKATRLLSGSEEHFLFDKYELLPKANHTYKYCDEMDRLVVPILGIHLHQLGIAVKDEFNKHPSQPKWIFYWEKPMEPKVHLRLTNERYVVVCEDIISADKLWTYDIPAIALLGTHLSEDNTVYLRKLGITKLYLALDPDAKDKMHKIKGKYSLLFDEIKMMFLDKDVKDTPISTIKEILDGTQTTVSNNTE